MTIAAIRVEHLMPTRVLAPSETCCWRCGQIFNHNRENVLAGSPCRDCRDVLRHEGDTTNWRRQRKAQE